MAQVMYEKQLEIVQTIMMEFEKHTPDAYSYISNEAIAAATGLEYYGMLRRATHEALDNGLIPKELQSRVKDMDDAIHCMYTS